MTYRGASFVSYFVRYLRYLLDVALEVILINLTSDGRHRSLDIFSFLGGQRNDIVILVGVMFLRPRSMIIMITVRVLVRRIIMILLICARVFYCPLYNRRVVLHGAVTVRMTRYRHPYYLNVTNNDIPRVHCDYNMILLSAVAYMVSVSWLAIYNDRPSINDNLRVDCAFIFILYRTRAVI